MTSSKVNLTYLASTKLDPERAVKTASLLAGVTKRTVRRQVRKALNRKTTLKLGRYLQILDMPILQK